MIAFDEAVALVAGVALPLGHEMVALAEAHRRVLAAPVVAMVDSPPADVSTMDGYAVRDADLALLPAALTVAGESLPGRGFDGALPPQRCIRIFTGAEMPAGADRVIVQEVVRRDGGTAHVEQPLAASRYIRKAGSDFCAGEVVVEAGTLLAPGAMIAAAAADVGQVTVHRRPRVRLLTTGDELADPGRARLVPGAIPDSLSCGIAALAEDYGGQVEQALRLADDLPTLEAAASEALKAADLVVVTGGASVGERDFARAMFGDALEPIFSGVAIKPGRPVWLGRARGALVLGLPGNPTSALVTARLFLAPLLCGLSGRDPADALRWRTMPLGEELEAVEGRETFSRGIERHGAAHLVGNQDSGSQKMLALSELLVRRRPGSEPLPAGSMVEVLIL